MDLLATSLSGSQASGSGMRSGGAYSFGVVVADLLVLVGIAFAIRWVYRLWMRFKFGVDRRRS